MTANPTLVSRQKTLAIRGASIDDNAIELFTRFQVTEYLQVTPDVQLIINPARHPSANRSWLFGLRARATF